MSPSDQRKNIHYDQGAEQNPDDELNHDFPQLSPGFIMT